MPKRPTKNRSQVSEFHKAARDLGADKSEKRFDAALKAVARHKPVDDPMPKDDPEALAELAMRNIQKD